MTLERREPQDEDIPEAQQLATGHGEPTDWPGIADWSATAARRFSKKVPNLVPEDSSAAAFVRWMQSHGETGEFDQEAVYDQYCEICEIAGYRPVPLKWFGRDLEKAGCQRWQADLRRNGRGRRPKVIRLPSVTTSDKRVPNAAIQLAIAA